MRVVADLAAILSIMATITGYMWRRHQLHRRHSNLEYMKNLELETKEMDKILEGMGANDVQHSNRADTGSGSRDDRFREGPEKRGVRRSERNQRG